jgi:hypothetical protein
MSHSCAQLFETNCLPCLVTRPDVAEGSLPRPREGMSPSPYTPHRAHIPRSENIPVYIPPSVCPPGPAPCGRPFDRTDHPPPRHGGLGLSHTSPTDGVAAYLAAAATAHCAMHRGPEAFRPFHGPSGDVLCTQWETLHTGARDLWRADAREAGPDSLSTNAPAVQCCCGAALRHTDFDHAMRYSALSSQLTLHHDIL